MIIFLYRLLIDFLARIKVLLRDKLAIAQKSLEDQVLKIWLFYGFGKYKKLTILFC